MDKFLPIGTVVLLRGGKEEVMITSYCIFPNNTELKDGKEVKAQKKIYEYGGCIYPEGLMASNQTCMFDHSQIEKIFFKGLVDEEETEFKAKLNGLIEQFGAVNDSTPKA